MGDIVAVLNGIAPSRCFVVLLAAEQPADAPPDPTDLRPAPAAVAIQIAAGMSAPWLPRMLLGRSIALTDVRRAVTRAVPILRRLERWTRPRVSVFETALGMRGMGIVLLALALALIVAAPIVGQIPLGLAVCLVVLGLVERDVSSCWAASSSGVSASPSMPLRLCGDRRGCRLLNL